MVEPVFLSGFKTRQDVIDSFRIDPEILDGCDLLFSAYGSGDWDGWATVIYRKDGLLYEVNGSHCSCNGLEGQWEPEQTTLLALHHRFTVGSGYTGYGEDGYKEEITAWLNAMMAEATILAST